MDVNLWYTVGIACMGILYVELSRRQWVKWYDHACADYNYIVTELLSENASLRNQVKQAKRAPRTYMERDKPALVLELQKLNRAVQRRNITIAHLRAQPAASSGEEAAK